jgi:two-component system NtrC family response regulator
MADSKRITEKDLELSTGLGLSSSTTLKEARENVEREMVQRALKRNLGRISSAAAELGISRPTLYELMEKLGISRE